MLAENNIVIIGGGFAGTTLAQALEKLLPTTHRLILVSDESYTTFNPMLAEVVGASVFPEHVIVPIRQMLRRTQFIMGTVQDVNYAQGKLCCATLAGLREIAFDHLVFAFGTRANLDLVPGMAEHALPLKLVGDALFIRNRVLRQLARMELESDPVLRRRLGHFIVVGGGFSGVEVAGELADYLCSIRRFYPRVQREELAVTLLHDTGQLLPELPATLGMAAARHMAARGIRLRLGTRAARFAADTVVLADGETIEGATVICTVGTKPNPLVATLERNLALATRRGRIETNPDMSVRGMPGLWAIGDCARVANAATDQDSLPTAQFAVAQARQLAHNLARHLEQRESKPFSYQSKGAMASIGHMKGVARLYGFSFSGLPAWLAWRALYLMRMPTLGRKLRLWAEWSWSMFFPTDITHLRFTRTSEADEWQREPLPPHRLQAPGASATCIVASHDLSGMPRASHATPAPTLTGDQHA
ncbi:NAD(P)/FAD-dependent oxidoreductase [Cupriavidus consociatus]|uniref:NAD(P)/FAD-dependent oxidoreductase n=1 Tax=Cupriavidus consociatus TaxID=2821357 RepID=UPI001AE4B839|nr:MULTISPECIES: NAD(P)/FAD-dependent oxidoreductase [unclassified Cupriavidus]MBP0621011.1 NAD(P)/FAD-dependent oxidoreductase [Cupriavidus sp. LEh25]MDK2657680.1 NAD(P)/FAD-dependent oxidoreductase [Cupriavidus sp. LEh21]